VGLVEQHRLPGPPQGLRVGRRAQPLPGRGKFLRRGQQPLQIALGLLEPDAAAVRALEDRVQLSGEHGPGRAPGHGLLEISRHGQAELKGRIGLAVELLDERGEVFFRLADVRAPKSDPVVAAGLAPEQVESILHPLGELGQGLGRAVGDGVALRQPERGDAGAVEPLPEELGGDVPVGHAAEEPKRLKAGELHDLRHLGMVAEGVELPAHGHVHSQLAAKVVLAVEDLAHEGLAAGHVDVGHHVGPAHDRQTPFGNQLAKGRLFLGIALEKGLYVTGLIKGETVTGLGLQKPHRPHDVGKAHFQVFLAGLEHGPFPVRVRDEPEHVAGWRRGAGLRGLCPEQAAGCQDRAQTHQTRRQCAPHTSPAFR